MTISDTVRSFLAGLDLHGLGTDTPDTPPPSPSDDLAKPSSSDITYWWMMKRASTANWRLRAMRERERRYQLDRTPQKWALSQKDGRRFYTRLTHNEINRVVAMQMENSPMATIMPRSDAEKERNRAAGEARWCNQLIGAFERIADRPVRRRLCDGQNEIGLMAYELYLNDAYKDIDTEPRTIPAPDGSPSRETARDVLKRTSSQLREAGLPFGVRVVDGMSLYYDADDSGIYRAAIVERKPYRIVWESMKRQGMDIGSMDNGVPIGAQGPMAGNDSMPQPGDAGFPLESWPAPGYQLVETVRYYDRRWYVYMVGGRIVDGPREHGMPFVPVVPCYGLVTSSPNVEFFAEGICWGMESIEIGLNDMLTLASDVQFTYNRPKFVIETAEGSDLMLDDAGTPIVLDLSNPSNAEQLNPGQKVTNTLVGFEPFLQLPLLQTYMNLWQMSGLNPIAQGESPGASPAGYSINALQGNASRLYQDLLQNEAQCTAKLFDMIRILVRDVIKMPVWLTAPMPGGKVEWLCLKPEDVSDVPCIVTIDPTSDANRLARRQSLMQAYKEGFISRRRVQHEGFAIDDPESEDDQILIDQIVQQLATITAQDTLSQLNTIIAGQQQANAVPPPGGQQGQPPGPLEQIANMGQKQGIVPGQPAPPPVGAMNAAASQGAPFTTQPGAPALQPRTALAGQGRAIVPQAGRP